MDYMARVTYGILIAICLVVILCSINLKADTPLIRGEVVASDGRPLPGVTVYGTGGKSPDFVPEAVKTDEKGFFQLEKPVKIIHFWVDGFRPLAVKVDMPANEIRIVLEDESRSSWTIRACPNLSGTKRMIGYGEVRFLIPSGTKLKAHHSEEGSSYSVYLPRQSIAIELSWAGLIGSPQEDDIWIAQSPKFSERWIKDTSNHPLGIDGEGETKESKLWRHSMFIGEMTASYSGVSQEAVKDYNALIDSACLRSRDRSGGAL